MAAPSDLLKTNKNHYDFWTALSPTYRMHKWIGLAQFNVEGPVGNRNFMLISLSSPYKITLYVFITCVALLIILLGEIIFPVQSDSMVMKHITKYQGNSVIILIFSVMISNAKIRKTMITCLREMVNNDERLRGCEILVDDKYVRNVFILWNFLYCLVFSASSMYSIIWQWRNFEICVISISYFTALFYKLTISLLFKNWIYCIKQRFEALNEKLHSSDAQGNCHYIQKVANAHYYLSLTVQKLNNCNVVPTLMCVTVDF